jgi:hypothetical protein
MEPYEIWTRKSFDVKAARVTATNIRAVAAWCNGKIGMSEGKKLYVNIWTVQFHRGRETKAFVGDWVVLIDGAFKHYRDKSFRQAYSKKLDSAYRKGQVMGMLAELVDEVLKVVDYPSEELLERISKTSDGILGLFGGERGRDG